MHKLDKLSIAIPSIEVSGHVLDDRTEKQISIHLNFLSVHFQNGFTLDRSTLIFFGCYICICWRVHFPILFFSRSKQNFLVSVLSKESRPLEIFGIYFETSRVPSQRADRFQTSFDLISKAKSIQAWLCLAVRTKVKCNYGI